MEASVAATPVHRTGLRIDSETLQELLTAAIREGVEANRAYNVVAVEPPTAAQKALTLHPKVAAPALATPVTVLVLYVLQAVWGIVPPVEVAAAITGIVAFVAGWLAPANPAPPAL